MENDILLQITGTDDNFSGESFFLRVPSVDMMSNASILLLPTGFYVNTDRPFHYFLRIYTNIDYVGKISIDDVTISALLYQRIAQSNYYYYERITTNNTHSIAAIQSNAKFAVYLNVFSFKYDTIIQIQGVSSL